MFWVFLREEDRAFIARGMLEYAKEQGITDKDKLAWLERRPHVLTLWDGYGIDTVGVAERLDELIYEMTERPGYGYEQKD